MTREEEIITMIEDVLSRKKAALRGHDIVLFGSRANGTAKERSDFDIGVVGEKPLDIKTFYDIEDEFDNIPTLYKIDFVDLAKTTDAFRGQALSSVRKLL